MEREGEGTRKGTFSVKREMWFLGNTSKLQDVKFRFTFTHVYIHELLNPKSKRGFYMDLVYHTLIYIRTSKLKPKPATSESVYFLFDWNRNMARQDGTSWLFVKKQTYFARKTCKMNVMWREFINFASKICRTCLNHGDAISV